MELTLAERLNLMPLLPQKGTYVQMTLKHSIMGKLTLSPDEIDAWNVRDEEGRVKWDVKADTSKEIDFSDGEKALLSGILSKMDEDGELTDYTYGLRGKFLG